MPDHPSSPPPHQSLDHAQRHAALGIHGLHSHEAAHDIRRVRRLHQTYRMAWGVVGLLLLGGVGVLWQRHLMAQTLETQREQGAERYVNFVQPKPGRDQAQVTLPATLVGLAETPIYAHTSGYVSHWYKDMGDPVKAGELLATIETPEVEQQLAQARAAQAQAQTSHELARAAFERWQALQQRDAVSRQELDDRRGAFVTAQSALQSTTAEVRRLEQLLSYNRIVAPFAGTVTLRNVEVGNLVDPGNGGLPKALFTISQSETLRTLVQVPQSYAPRVHVGQAGRVSLTERPGESYAARVSRTAGAIDAASRTLEVELRIPNDRHVLLPGSYAQVTLDLGAGPAGGGVASAAGGLLVLPNNSLLFRPEGSLVALVSAEGKVHLQPVTVGRDLGVLIEIRSGLTPADRVIVNPPDALAEGDAVKAEPLPVPAQPSAGKRG